MLTLSKNGKQGPVFKHRRQSIMEKFVDLLIVFFTSSVTNMFEFAESQGVDDNKINA